MDFRQFLRILWARKWSVVIMTLLGVLVAVVLSYVLQPRYTASTQIVIDFKGIDPVSGAMLPAQMLPGYMSTQFDIIRSHNVALKVVRELKLADSPFVREQWISSTQGRGAIEDWLANLIVSNLDLLPTRDSSVVSISYTGQDPQFAAALADAFAQAYIETNLELRVAPAQDVAVWFDEQLKTLRTNLSRARARLAAYQREKGFTSTDERTDIDATKLAEMMGQLVSAETAFSDLQARKRQLDEFLASGRDPESLPDILGNPLIQQLKSQINAAEARREQLSSQLGENHPDSQRVRAEIQNLRRALGAEIKTVSTTMNNVYRISERRQSELRSTLAGQKSRILDLNRARDELSVLVQEVEGAQRALDAANARLTQENLQSRISSTNVMILSRAIPPLYPSFPKLILNVPLGFLVGLFLGVNLALLWEFFDRRVRSGDDLRDLGNLRVLGTLPRSTRGARERLRLFLPSLRSRHKALPA
jgi:succinoglycan biosynthesis transport protein ExoP